METNEVSGSGTREGDMDESRPENGFIAYCPRCRGDRLFKPARVSTLQHLLATIFTLGLWSMIWIAILIGKSLRPWRCEACKWHKPEHRKVTVPPAVKILGQRQAE